MKRRLAIAAVCLVLGAIVNVLVAWGIGAFVDPDEVLLGEAAGWPLSAPTDWPEPQVSVTSAAFGYASQFTANYGTGRRGPDFVMSVRSYGWPTFSLRTREAGLVTNVYTPTWSGPYCEGLAPPEFLNAQPVAYNRLALDPLWPGFVFNTLFCGVPIWVVGVAPFALRRVVRRRRGRCVACGYDLAGLDRCPECGAE